MPRPPVTLICVADGAGIGNAPDADTWGTPGANTLGNAVHAIGGLTLPTLHRWGLGNLTRIPGVPPVATPAATIARAVEHSAGNDTPTGHYELFGHITTTPAPTYPNGFPDATIAALTTALDVDGILCNAPYGGLDVIAEYGPEHQSSGRPIIYTSADPVLQIAAHTDQVPIEQLWAWCATALEICNTTSPVQRVIARPFTGTPGNYTRDSTNRRDYANPAPRTTIDTLAEAGVPVVAVGKIGDIFTHRGFTDELHPPAGIRNLMFATWNAATQLDNGGVIIVNLTEFDYRGHARDPLGYTQALVELDDTLEAAETLLEPGDRIIVCADHGNDPTYTHLPDGTPTADHTRERTPILVLTIGQPGRDAGTVDMSDLGASLAAWHNTDHTRLAGHPTLT